MEIYPATYIFEVAEFSIYYIQHIMERFDKDLVKMPIYQKAGELLETVQEIADLVPEDNEYLKRISGQMVGDAMIIQAKIAGAEAGDLYDLRVENAAIIRKAAREIMIVDHAFKAERFEFVEYFELVRARIEEFRILFIEWVESFDKWNYIIDRWGLFNPPGVGPYDKDPDDDIPWEGPDFGEL